METEKCESDSHSALKCALVDISVGPGSINQEIVYICTTYKMFGTHFSLQRSTKPFTINNFCMVVGFTTIYAISAFHH